MVQAVVRTADTEQEPARQPRERVPQPARVPARPTVRSTHGQDPRQHVDTMAPALVSTTEPPLHVPAPLQPVSTMVLPPPARAVVQRRALPARQHLPAATQRRKQHAVVQAALQTEAIRHLLPAVRLLRTIRHPRHPRTARLPIQRLPRRAVALRLIQVDPAGVLLPLLPHHQVVREVRLVVAAAVVDESIQYNALI
jgi:hypothetical protein